MTSITLETVLSVAPLLVATGMALSVAMRRPWTGPFAALVYRDVSGTPLFQTINMAISGLWALLMLWLAFAHFAELPLAAHEAYWARVKQGEGADQ